MAGSKPSAKEISEAKASAGRHRKTPGEEQATSPRPVGTPTKKRPSGNTGRTRNEALERPAPAPRRSGPKQPAENLRVGRRVPKRGRAVRASESRKKD